jgi:hypothetical protein
MLYSINRKEEGKGDKLAKTTVHWLLVARRLNGNMVSSCVDERRARLHRPRKKDDLCGEVRKNVPQGLKAE